jgi:hypothetical protein
VATLWVMVGGLRSGELMSGKLRSGELKSEVMRRTAVGRGVGERRFRRGGDVVMGYSRFGAVKLWRSEGLNV